MQRSDLQLRVYAVEPSRGKRFPDFELFQADRLLVAEGFDGIEAGGFPRGVDAEDDADQCAEDQRGDDPE